MRSLLVRIFVSFWSIILITILAAGALGYFYAERVRSAMQSGSGDNGNGGLSQWLRCDPGRRVHRLPSLNPKDAAPENVSCSAAPSALSTVSHVPIPPPPIRKLA